MIDEREGVDVTPTVDWLLHPVPRDEYLRDFWKKRHFLLRRNAPDHYGDLFSLARFDELLSGSDLDAGSVRVVRAGRADAAGDAVGSRRLEDLYDRYRRGSTMIMPSVHERWPPLRDLCRRLAYEFSARCRVNAYLTPPMAQGFGVHRDSHDVFVLQVAGGKRWKVYEAGPEPERTSPCEEFDLRQGDLLYLPRGIPHEAASTHSASLHLSLGVFPITWADVLLAGCEAAVDGDAAFRDSLPFGFARTARARDETRERMQELTARLWRAVAPDALVDDAVDLALLTEGDRLNGHLLDLVSLAALDHDTVVRRRPDLRWEIRRDAGTMVVAFHGKRLSIPSRHEEAFLRMATGEPFTTSGLKGEARHEIKLSLVRRLLEEGFLTLSPPL
ncbi:cupin domain-containing protein [Nonomuraea sp. NPDC004186]